MSDRTKICRIILFITFHVLEVGQKDIIQIAFEYILNGSVSDFRRKTIGAFHPGYSLSWYILRDKYFDSQGMKEPGVKRPEGINGKTAGNTDNVFFFLYKIVGIGGTFLKKKIVALFYIIRYFSFINDLFLSDIGILVTSTAEHVLIIINSEYANRAEVIARFALKLFFINNIGGKYLIEIIRSPGQKAFL